MWLLCHTKLAFLQICIGKNCNRFYTFFIVFPLRSYFDSVIANELHCVAGFLEVFNLQKSACSSIIVSVCWVCIWLWLKCHGLKQGENSVEIWSKCGKGSCPVIRICQTSRPVKSGCWCFCITAILDSIDRNFLVLFKIWLLGEMSCEVVFCGTMLLFSHFLFLSTCPTAFMIVSDGVKQNTNTVWS